MPDTGTSARILVVDDNEANRYAICRLLKQAGYDVIEAANGVQALRQLVHRPDLMIADVHMPEMDGYELSRRVRADPATRTLPILQLSATYTSPDDVIAGLERGADGYLTHPVDPGVLIATVRALLRARRAEEQLQRMQRLETVGRLAGGFAHETNNQMAVVLGLTGFLSRSPGLTPDQRADVEQIRGAAERVAQLTRQLLALSRRQMMQPELANLDAIVQEANVILRRLLGAEIEITLDQGPDPKWVRADRTQLAQVILNLALNARDAMPAGGRLTLRTRLSDPPETPGRFERVWPPRVRVAVLTVSDTGTGIEPTIANRVFDPFFTTKSQGQGTGLGLSVVDGIVEQSGGDLWVESRPGAGTTFTIALPLAEAPSSPPGDAGSGRGTGRGSETLLLVEDEQPVRTTIARGLTDAGYRVLETSSGEEALSLLRTSPDPIALVITDVAMPGMSGIELARKAAELDSELPFLFISGHSEDVVFNARAEGERIPFLQKPFAPEVLAVAVRSALDQAHAAP
jgi:two-component system cell cycle sensor histidine kinase/response regulator CckA